MPTPLDPSRRIRIRGAHEHNLQHVDLDLPREALIVVTGVSGSGKSSLAFDTLFKEGQRRYLETFPSYARQLLGKLDRPAAEQMDGLSPALAVDQKSGVRNPRSTVGTLTDLHAFLRLLFARLGMAHCAECKAELAERSAEDLVEAVRARFAGSTLEVLAPVVDGHRGSYRKELTQLADQGFAELRIDGKIVPAKPTPQLDSSAVHTIAAVVARLEIAPARAAELSTAVDRALRLGKGVLEIVVGDRRERFSSRQACPQCGAPVAEIGPRLFSFNSPYGACPACNGLGVQDSVDPELMVGDADKTLREGALVLTTPSGYIVYSQVTMDVLDQVCRAHGFNVDIPWKDLTAEQRRVVLYGSDRIKVPFGKHPLESRLKWKGITARPREEGVYKGIVPTIEETLKRNRNENALRFVRSRPCQDCGGRRLRPEALSVTFRGRSIADLSELPLDALAAILAELPLTASESPIATPILEPMRARLDVLRDLGLGYLPLARESTTLSGGEAQRIRLATQAGTNLRGLLYVLDEPSLGLHPRDHGRLMKLLRALRDQGNTVVVVEHDEETMRGADWLIDIGPGAGPRGGRLLYSGPPAGIASTEDSVTGAFLTGRTSLPARLSRRPGRGELTLRGAREHNLQNLDVTFKVGALNVVTGVSGAGKSTLVHGTLGRALRRRLHGATELPGAHRAIEGVEAVDKVIDIDQAAIGRTPRSNPATYTGLTDFLRDLFSGLPESKARGWKKGRFSFNVEGGRCEACGGAGVQSIGMHFLADVEIVCEACGGKRFNDETLEVRYRGHSIGQVLELTVEQALELFADQKGARRILEAMQSVGLGYLTLGQPATTLSGGEAQRVKLSSELGRASTGNTLYLLDEPTSGLHLADVRVLLQAIDGLVERGNTVVVIEHHLDVVRAADWVVDLGPEGGSGGGRVVFAGTPEELERHEASHTGAALRAPLSQLSARALGREAPAADLRLVGVTTHNLRGIDALIPANKLTVITGVSGSGKSSLAFDTLFNEGQRRFTESLSSHARRFASRLRHAELSDASGLTPAVAIRQEPAGRSPRSTVGTLTEVYDTLRLLYARAGTAFCPACAVELRDSRCPRCGFRGSSPLTARMFSFNHVQGACPACKGVGSVTSCDPARLISDPSKPLVDGAMDGHKTGQFYGERHGQHLAILTAVGEAKGIDFSRPWTELDEDARRVAMFGTGDERYEVTWRYQRKKVAGEHVWKTAWKGFAGYVNEEYERKHADDRAEAMLPLMRELPCAECRGERLKPEYRAVRFAGMTLGELCRKPVAATRTLFEGLEQQLDARSLAISADARAEISRRLAALCDVGLDYLSLDRGAATLSGGEAQRLRLATQLGAGLRGVTYVLDEPTIGLHARDTEPLLALLGRLRDSGNTVVVVEHDAQVMNAADHLIDLGPGAGSHGGRIVAQGSIAEIRANASSKTGQYLRDPRSVVPVPATRRKLGPGISVRGATTNNLRELDCDLPSGGIVALTGVSGSGKSTLAFDVVLASSLLGAPAGCRELSGLERFRALRCVGQDSFSGSALSTPLTYLDAFDAVRGLFAMTEVARAQAWTKSRFSLATKGGRCEACQGTGRLEVRMDFLPDVTIPCEECRGARFSSETLEATWRGHTIADVLALTARDAVTLFGDIEGLAKPLRTLDEVGLGYLQLGQPTSTLSGGEGQRLRLAAELARGTEEGLALYLFDEPTTGLHPEDVARLLGVFHRLADAGHTLLVIEHNLDVIACADWVVDLGPGGGERGGRIVAQGTPEELARCAESFTGQALRPVLPPGPKGAGLRVPSRLKPAAR